MSFRLCFVSKVPFVLWSLDSVSLPGRCQPRLRAITAEIPAGVTAIMGQSGAGKTSLLNLLVGFERPKSGVVRYVGRTTDNRLLLYWAPPQQGLWPHLTVREHLASVGAANQDHLEFCDRILAEFDLSELRDARPDSLSMGERSRVNVARALCSNAMTLVMDEPLAHVDLGRSRHYWNVISDVAQSRKISLVFSTHSPEVVLREAQHVICLSQGQVIYSGSSQQLYDSPASCELSLILGPCNWLSPADFARWGIQTAAIQPRTDSNQDVAGHCVRPENLIVEVADDSPLRVEDVRHNGQVGELNVRDERTGLRKDFVYRSGNESRIAAGQRVVLKLLMLLLFCFLGCGGSDESSLAVKSANYWIMIPDGPRVPAPRGMTVSPDNEYLVLDNVGRVLAYNEDGAVTRSWWMPEYSIGKAEGICVLKDGRIAVADTHYHQIVLFNHDGEFVSKFGKFGSLPGEFVYPVKVIQDPDENLYICEYGRNDRVQKFRPDGTFILQFGEQGTDNGQFQRPSGIVWFDHLLYVVDAFNNRIQVFTDKGQFIRILGHDDKPVDVRYPYDITIDGHGDLFVVEYGGDRVSKISREGKLLGRYGKSGPGRTLDEFSTPWGIAMDRRGRLYVCDTGNRRIVELEL